jgi:hypothetical protein
MTTIRKLLLPIIGGVLLSAASAGAQYYSDYDYYDYYDGAYDSTWDQNDWFYDYYDHDSDYGTSDSYYDSYDYYDYDADLFDWEEDGLFE